MKITELQLIGTNVNNQSSVIDKPLLGLLTNYALTRVLWPKKEDSSLFITQTMIESTKKTPCFLFSLLKLVLDI